MNCVHAHSKGPDGHGRWSLSDAMQASCKQICAAFGCDEAFTAGKATAEVSPGSGARLSMQIDHSTKVHDHAQRCSYVHVMLGLPLAQIPSGG